MADILMGFLLVLALLGLLCIAAVIVGRRADPHSGEED